MKAVSPINDDGLSKTDGESTTCPVVDVAVVALLCEDTSSKAHDDSTTYPTSDVTVVPPSNETTSSKADDDSTTCPISDIAVAALSSEDTSNKAHDDSTTCPINDVTVVPPSSETTSSKADDVSTTCPVCDIAVVPLSCETTSSKFDDEYNAYPISEVETELTTDPISITSLFSSSNDDSSNETREETEAESDEESTADTFTNVVKEGILREQTRETWYNLVEVAENKEIDGFTQLFAGTVADIVEWWQSHTINGNPTSHFVDFGVGSPINLLMILALLPERYQGLIRIEDESRSPSGDGENLSWLHEQTTEILVRLSVDPDSTSMHFRESLASMIRDSVDEGWRVFTGRSWLEDQIHLLSNNDLEPDLYRFPPGTDKIVFLFNPTEAHWTVVEVDIDDYVWTYTLYNSLFQGEKGPTWKACQEQLPLLEQLICRASGFAEPATREIVIANSAQQENGYDCGPIAIYNAIELLEGRKPSTEIDAEVLRLKYLMLIRDALYLFDQGLETPAFRAYMRKVCLAYLP